MRGSRLVRLHALQLFSIQRQSLSLCFITTIDSIVVSMIESIDESMMQTSMRISDFSCDCTLMYLVTKMKNGKESLLSVHTVRQLSV